MNTKRMHIHSIERCRDGGTVRLEGVFEHPDDWGRTAKSICVDDRMDSDTRGVLYWKYPADEDAEQIVDAQYVGQIRSAIQEYLEQQEADVKKVLDALSRIED